LFSALALGSLSHSHTVIAEFPNVEGGAGVRALVSLMAPNQVLISDVEGKVQVTANLA